MFKQWAGKSVDLRLLSDGVVEFLKRKGFRSKKTDVAKGFLVSGTGPFSGGVVVRISGEPDDFVVELESGATRDSVMLGSSTLVFGGGRFLLRGLKSKEALDKLENEFWISLEGLVIRLEGSAKHPGERIYF